MVLMLGYSLFLRNSSCRTQHGDSSMEKGAKVSADTEAKISCCCSLYFGMHFYLVVTFLIWRYDLLDSKLVFYIKLLWSFKVLFFILFSFFKIFSSLKPNLNSLYNIYHCQWLSSLILYSYIHVLSKPTLISSAFIRILGTNSFWRGPYTQVCYWNSWSPSTRRRKGNHCLCCSFQCL